MKKIIFLALLFSWCFYNQASANPNWLAYNKAITLTGRLTGEANLGTYFLLLENAVNLKGTPTDPINNISEPAIQKIQLVFSADQIETVKRHNRLNTEISVAGYLFHAHTKRQLTKILMQIKNIFPEPISSSLKLLVNAKFSIPHNWGNAYRCQVKKVASGNFAQKEFLLNIGIADEPLAQMVKASNEQNELTMEFEPYVTTDSFPCISGFRDNQNIYWAIKSITNSAKNRIESAREKSLH